MLFGILFVYSVTIARNFLYPIALAILFAYLLLPIANFFERRHFPRILANLLSIIIGVGIVAAAIYFMYHQIEILMADSPSLKIQAMKNIDSLGHFVEQKFGIPQSRQKLLLKENVGKIFDNGSAHAGRIFASTSGGLIRVGLLPVFVFFMLYYRDKAYDFILMLVKPENREQAADIVGEISLVTKNYMGGVVTVVSILCVLNPLGLYFAGVEYAILLGIIAAICNFIPYFGTILGFLFPFVFALFTGESPQTALGVVLLFVIIQFTENNILTPNIVGGNVKLNPFVVILSLIIGGMVWGVPGMFVIIPLMAVFRIICENVDILKPYGFLLGVDGTEKHAVTVEKIKAIPGRIKSIFTRK